jgi:hypothetical protein
MRPAEDIRRFIDKAAVSTNPTADQAVLEAVLIAHKKANEKTSAAFRPSLRSIVMRSPITKLAAAVMVVVAVVLFTGLWNKSAPSAYALEQTIEANRGIRCLHIRNFTTGHEEPREGWIEFDADGQAKKMRAHLPEWASPVEGAWVIVWKDDTVQRWIKRQNCLETAKAGDRREQLNATLQEIDPRLVSARIAELQQQGKVETTIEEPSDETQPIVMTVTYLAGSDNPGQRKVLSIDPATKLINLIEVYRLTEGQYRRESRIELGEYNQPIDPRTFDLTNEVPTNAQRLDVAHMGLAQGQLSDEEAAVKAVRQFFESLMAGNYDAAGKLILVGAAGVKEQFGRVKILRIVSIGPATAAAGSGDKVFGVPCTIEYEEDSKQNSITIPGIKVRPLPNQPDRWVIDTFGE